MTATVVTTLERIPPWILLPAAAIGIFCVACLIALLTILSWSAWKHRPDLDGRTMTVEPQRAPRQGPCPDCLQYLCRREHTECSPPRRPRRRGRTCARCGQDLVIKGGVWICAGCAEQLGHAA